MADDDCTAPRVLAMLTGRTQDTFVPPDDAEYPDPDELESVDSE